MFSFAAFLAMFASGSRGYPILAYSRTKTSFQRLRNLTPPVIVTVSTEVGCKRITYSQGELAALYRL